MIPSLPGRDLTPEELELLVHDLAARREEWHELVRYDADKRWYECLHRDAHVDVWLISWIEEQDTGWHDHDVSSGAVAVVDGVAGRGASRARPGRRTGASCPRARAPASTRRTCTACGWPRAQERAISMHAYSPPLWRLGVYRVDEEGMLRRESVSYAEELRPVA